MKKFCLLLTVLTVCCTTMQAQFHGGSGTVADPYLVADGYDMADMANYRTSHFKQISDIDLSEWITDNAPSLGWMPIGTEDAPFEGSFDGGGFVIKGLVINRPTSNNIGLFGLAKIGMKIQNICLEAPAITGNQNVGCIVGNSSDAITNCHVTSAVIIGTYNVGAICGSCSNMNISNCTAEIRSLQGSQRIGGIAGLVTSSIENCLTTALRISGMTWVGGIVGSHSGTAINKCIAIVERLNVSGFTVGTSEAGGIVGREEGGNISECYAYANIDADGYAGGICGSSSCHRKNHTANVYSYNTDNISYPVAKESIIRDCSTDGTFCSTITGGITGHNYGYKSELLPASNNYNLSTSYCKDGWDKWVREGIKTRSSLVRHASINANENAAGIDAFQTENSKTRNVENCVSLATLVSSKTTDNAYRIVSNTYGKNNKAYNQTELIQSNKKVLNITDDDYNGIAYGEKTLMRSSAYTGLGWDFNSVWTIQEGESLPYFQTQTDYPIVTEESGGSKAMLKGTCKSNGKLTIIKNGNFITTQILDNTWEANLGAVSKGDTLLVYSQAEGKMPSVVVRYVFDSTGVTPEPQGKPGDANGDGVVDASDVTAIINYILGKPSASFNKENADVTDDGEILIDDAVNTVQMIMDAQ